nr:tripartite tricarboxylate transporter permease [Natronohydrobacter thiooxidans]
MAALMQDQILENILLGLSVAISPSGLFYCLIGVVLGTITGIIPGIGALAAVSLLFPITFHLAPTEALIMLAGIYYGTTYGGSTASILLNLPGTPSSAVACLDGYPMAQKGRGGVALFMTTIASFVGGSIGILVLIFLAPMIISVAFMFAPADYFSLILLGLIMTATISGGSVVKALIMSVFGILLGVVGLDVYYGSPRYTFGILHLYEGISLVALAIGLFGIAEVIASIGKMVPVEMSRDKLRMRNMLPSREEGRGSIAPILRGAGIGTILGALPGTGGTIASYISYAVERRFSRTPDHFGKGAMEGLVGPESSNNAADQTAFIPTLTLGIPGTATMAIMLGVLMIHGINPGPRLVVEQPALFWGLIMSFWIGNLLLLIINIPMIGIWVRILAVPYKILYPSILAFVCVGIYSINNSVFDILVVVAFGVVGYGTKLLGLPLPPLLLGFVLGPMLEEHFRRAMLLSQGSFEVFVTRPISGAAVLIMAVALLYAMVRFVLSNSEKNRTI